MSLEAMLSELLAEHETPGAAIGLVDAANRTIVTAGSRGEGRGAVEHDTIFAAASLTKPVFAAGVMTLVDDGALDLDQPLIEYLPDPYLADDERAASITARMVLSHTTGLPNWREGSDDRVHPSHGTLHLRWSPGTRWGYSGEGFSYLQRVVEHLAAAPIANYLTDVLFRPLDMTDSTFAWPEADEPRLAIGHDESRVARPRFCPPEPKAAAGGLFTTAVDYPRFLDHCLVHEQRMFVQHAPIDDAMAWGLGWGIEIGEENAVWQWGNDPGYKNFVIGRPMRRVGLVVHQRRPRCGRVCRGRS
jgi:CubicO group peptidase (beta-lactamase class C family)